MQTQSTQNKSTQNKSTQNKSTQKSLSVKGYIPLYYAGLLYLTEVLKPHLMDSIKELESWKTDEKLKSRTFSFVNIPDLKNNLEILCDDNVTKKIYTLDILHYAPKKRGSKDRDFDIWNRMNTLSPFRSAQQHMKEMGYYLVEEGNFGTKIKLYNCHPPACTNELWHKHNILEGITYDQQNSENKKETKQIKRIKRRNHNLSGIKLTNDNFPTLPTKSEPTKSESNT